MKEIIFTAIYGDIEKTVKLSQPMGGGGIYYITIDNYFHGQIVLQQNKWVVYPNRNSDLTMDDIDYLIELIENSH